VNQTSFDRKNNEYVQQPTTVKVGGKIIYQGKDAREWLERTKDRNIQATARLTF